MEPLFANITHGVTLAGVVTLLGLFLRQHGIWLRMKERLNHLWRDRCIARGDEYVPVEKESR